MSETRMSEPADATPSAPLEPAGSPASASATTVKPSDDWWQQHDQRVYACIELWVEQWWQPQQRVLIDAIGEVFGQERHNRREAIAKIKERVLALETTSSFEERFNKLVYEVKNEFEIPQSEVLAKAVMKFFGDPGPFFLLGVQKPSAHVTSGFLGPFAGGNVNGGAKQTRPRAIDVGIYPAVGRDPTLCAIGRQDSMFADVINVIIERALDG